ncbi:serpentine type 7TM GPCR chemoreceptor srd domain-containing protein [Ditylenchus destructor]|nr:serpentine type 7TM GPCR chemoreceptor srd domain-containing protein [Ditylenchus destructor]
MKAYENESTQFVLIGWLNLFVSFTIGLRMRHQISLLISVRFNSSGMSALVKEQIRTCMEHFAYDDAVVLSDLYHKMVNSESSLYLLAQSLVLSKQIEAAYDVIHGAEISGSNISANCRFLIAKCAYELKRFQECENHLRDITVTQNVEINPVFIGSTTLSFAHSLLAKVLNETDRKDFAELHLKRAYKSNPLIWSNAKNYCDAGGRIAGRDLRRTFGNLSIISPHEGAIQDSAGQNSVGEMAITTKPMELKKQSKFGKSILKPNRLSQLSENLMINARNAPETWCAAANCYSLEEDHNKAVECLERAIQLSPNYAYGYALLGHELVRLDQFDWAAAAFRLAIHKRPNDYRAWFGLGVVHFNQEQLALARMNFAKAAQINSMNKKVRKLLDFVDKQMNKVRLVHDLNSAACLIIGGVLNILLICLIRRKTSKEMTVYSRILLQTCIIDLYVLLIGYLLQPIFFVNEGNSSHTWNGPIRSLFHPSEFIHFALFCAWIVGGFLSSASMTMQFVFRYLLLCRNITISHFVYMLLIIVPGAFCVVWMNLIFDVTSGNSPPTMKIYNDSNFYYLLRESVEEEYVVASLSDQKGSLTCIIGCMIMNAVFYLIIIASALRMKMFVRKQKESMNAEKLKKMEQQMTYILATQAFMPSIQLAVHTFTLTCYVIFTKSSAYFLMYLSVPVYWLPVFNPLATMLIIRNYRNFILAPCKRRQNYGSKVTLTEYTIAYSQLHDVINFVDEFR